MMKQLTERQRYELQAYLQAGTKKDEIAHILGIHRSTLYRELCRNKYNRTDSYKGDYAQYLYELRKEQRIRPMKFTMCVKARAEAMLVELNYSPEQIVGRCKGLGFSMVSVERLYQWIWDDKRKGGDLYRSLRRKGRKHGKRGATHNSRGCIPNRKDISERPAVVEKRKRWGDLEIDTIIGKNHKGAILTINERKSGCGYGHASCQARKPNMWLQQLLNYLCHIEGGYIQLHQTMDRNLQTINILPKN